MATFKDRLSELVEEKKDKNYKYTREDYAEFCQITVGQLDGYLKGNGTKFCEVLTRIAKNNSVSVAWLIGASDNRFDDNIPFDDSIPFRKTLNKLSARDLYTIQQLAEFLLVQSKAKKSPQKTIPKQ